MSGWATDLAMWWTQTYTSRLPADERERRCAEVWSDLWEQDAHAATVAQRPSATRLDVLGRVLLGVPADGGTWPSPRWSPWC